MKTEQIRPGVFEGKDGRRRAVWFAGDDLVRYDNGKGQRHASREAFAAWAKRQLCATCGGTGYALVRDGDHRVGQQVCPDPACTEPIHTCGTCGHRRHLSKPEEVAAFRAGRPVPCAGWPTSGHRANTCMLPVLAPATIVDRAAGALLAPDDEDSPGAWKDEAAWRDHMALKAAAEEATRQHAAFLATPEGEAWLEGKRQQVTDALRRLGQKGDLRA